jgi:hypothetical protein
MRKERGERERRRGDLGLDDNIYKTVEKVFSHVWSFM